MHWFRMHHEARNDAKLRTLTDAQFRVWFNLLCFASEQPDRGTIESTDDNLLALEVSGGDVDLMNQTIARLQTLRILTESDETVKRCETVSSVSSRFMCVSPRFIAFQNFEKRNGRNVSRNAKTSTERVRKYREAKRLHQYETHETHETLVKRDETSLAGARAEIRLDEIRLDEIAASQQPPLPPEGGVVVARETALTIEAENAIEDIRAKHGEPAADLARREAKLIDRQLGGRWDLFVDAIEAASRRRPKLEDRNVLSWCMTRAVANLHKPPGVGNGVATSGAADALPTETLEQRKARLSKATEAMKAHLARGGR